MTHWGSLIAGIGLGVVMQPFLSAFREIFANAMTNYLAGRFQSR